MSVTPANPAWNDTITITGGGFRPGHEVNVGLCSPMSIAVLAGHLTTCPGTTVTADASGNVTVAIPVHRRSLPRHLPALELLRGGRSRDRPRRPGTMDEPGLHPAHRDGDHQWQRHPRWSTTGVEHVSCPCTCAVRSAARSLIPNGSAFRASAPADGDYTIIGERARRRAVRSPDRRLSPSVATSRSPASMWPSTSAACRPGPSAAS